MQKQEINQKIDGSNYKIAIILPYFNQEFGQELLANTKKELQKNKVKAKNITTEMVAGALETPLIAKIMAKSKKFDAIIVLGVVIKGKTAHFDLVNKTSHDALMKIQLELEKPIIFGILTCNNVKQVKERVSIKKLNKGKSFAQSALIQIELLKKIKSKKYANK